MAEVEAQAHDGGVPLDIVPLKLDGAVVATAYSFERRVLGMASGIRDGVVVLSSMWEPHLTPWLCHRLQDFMAFECATFRLAGTGIGQFSPDPVAIRNRSLTAALLTCEVQQVMPLDERVEAILEQGDRDADGEVVFNFTSGASPSAPSSLRELTAKNAAQRRFYRKAASIERFVSAQPHPYRASLTQRDGHVIGLASGFIEDDLALMACLLEDRDRRETSPPPMLHAFLARRLIEEGVRALGFMGGCAASLLPSCESVPGAELLLLRNARSARIKHRLCVLTQPRGSIARLSEALSEIAGI